jgi:hypothetical protein
MKKCCNFHRAARNGLWAMPVGVSQLAWFRVFASDKSGAVSIEFVILVASLMGVGTLSAVTVQSGALVRAGVISQGLDEAQQLANAGANVPIILPEIGTGGTNLPGGETATGGSDQDPVIVTVGNDDGNNGSGGGLPGGTGGDSGGDDCPAALIDPDLGPLECNEQAAADL